MNHEDKVLLWTTIGAIAGLYIMKPYGDQAVVIGIICGGLICAIMSDVWCEEEEDEENGKTN